MKQSLHLLIAALREELQQYGEMLARLDRQQEQVIARAADDVFESIRLVQEQGEVIQAARAHREQCRATVAQAVLLPGDASFALLIPMLPQDYRPLVKALVDENNALLVRVQQRARQNHLLLSRSVELMQSFLNTFFPARETVVYNDRGTTHTRAVAMSPIYEAVG